MTLLLTCLALGSPAWAAEPGQIPAGWRSDSAGGFVHEPSGIAFPAELNGAVAGNVQVYDSFPDNASIDYVVPATGLTATLYVYPRSLGLKKPKAEFQAALSALTLRHGDATFFGADHSWMGEKPRRIDDAYYVGATWRAGADRMGGWVILAHSPTLYFKVRASCRLTKTCYGDAFMLSLALLQNAMFVTERAGH